MCRLDDDTQSRGRWKEGVMWLGIVCILALVAVGLITFKHAHDKRQTVEYVGKMAYGSHQGVGWGGAGTFIGTIDGTIEIGLRGDGTVVYRRLEDKK